MRFLATLFCGIGALAGFRSLKPAEAAPRIIVIGEHRGYLSPCGCTSPMTGGIRRQASRVRDLKTKGSIVVDTGELVEKVDAQNILKGRTLAQSLAKLGVDAINLTADDSKLGAGELLSIASLSGNRLTSSSLEPSPSSPVLGAIEKDGFLIVGVSVRPNQLASRLQERPVSLDRAVSKAVQQAAERDLRTILLLDGDEAQAEKLARAHPMLAMIAYRSNGKPPRTLKLVGAVALVTPGERGQNIVTVSLPPSGPADYAVSELSEDVPDDPGVSRLYQAYLKQVTKDQLWEKTPRANGPAFTGSERCGECHQAAYKVWRNSDHSHALHTLAKAGHNHDPDCLVCHVTGASWKSGFQSLGSTPRLADVGCESCHGAGASHSRSPRKVQLAAIGKEACTQCHNALNSPRFDFTSYWAKVRHGR